jgi:hypothetical protein
VIALPALALGLIAFRLSIAAFWSKRFGFGPLIPCGMKCAMFALFYMNLCTTRL